MDSVELPGPIKPSAILRFSRKKPELLELQPLRVLCEVTFPLLLLLLDAVVGLAFDLRYPLCLRLVAEDEFTRFGEFGAASCDLFDGEVVHLERLGLGDFVLAHLRGLEQPVDGALKLVRRL